MKNNRTFIILLVFALLLTCMPNGVYAENSAYSDISLDALQSVIEKSIAKGKLKFTTEADGEDYLHTVSFSSDILYETTIVVTADADRMVKKVEFSGYTNDVEYGWTAEGRIDWSNITYIPSDISELYNKLNYKGLETDLKNSSYLKGYELYFDMFWLSYSYIMCCLNHKTSTFKSFKDYYGIAEIIKAKDAPQKWGDWEYTANLIEDNTTIQFVAVYSPNVA